MSERTVHNAAEFARAVEAVQEISPEAAERVLRGEVRDAITRLPRVAKDRPEDLPDIAEKLAAGARSISEVLQPSVEEEYKAEPEEEALPEPAEPNGSAREAETNHRLAVHFSSERMDWETPQDFFDRLDAEFHFTLDVCATPQNAKCQKFFTPEEDGLKQRWSGVCWMNPPYGNEIANWMRKAYEESRRGAVVVCLVPSRTDTGWWHKYIMKAEEIRFVRGRLHFGDAETSAPFPSAVVVLRPGHEGPPRVSGMTAGKRHALAPSGS